MIRYVLDRPVSTLFLAASLVVGTAYVFQYVFGYMPCELCYWQRYPYLIAIVMAGIAMMFPARTGLRFILPTLAGLFVIDAAIAFFHVGVEQDWWQGPATCGGVTLSGDLATDLEALLKTPVVRCDEIAWSLFGLSMAAWNGLAALILALFALVALKMKTTSNP